MIPSSINGDAISETQTLKYVREISMVGCLNSIHFLCFFILYFYYFVSLFLLIFTVSSTHKGILQTQKKNVKEF